MVTFGHTSSASPDETAFPEKRSEMLVQTQSSYVALHPGFLMVALTEHDK